jgi:hypothetical protein
METNTLIQSIVSLLTEAYSGPPDPSETWFIDNEPDSGILGLISKVTSVEASISVDGSGKPGSTIASNVEHLRWSLANANATLQGQIYQANWGESWHLQQTDPPGWQSLRQALRSEYEAILTNISRQEDLPGPFLNGVLALIPHATFHLGLIRQMLERVRGRG